MKLQYTGPSDEELEQGKVYLIAVVIPGEFRCYITVDLDKPHVRRNYNDLEKFMEAWRLPDE